MLAKAILIGRLGKDPEERHTKDGKIVANFSLATNQMKDVTEWHNIIVWEKLAENCMKYLSKGKMAYIEGRITSRKWTNKQGQEVTSQEVVAMDVKFLSPREEKTIENISPQQFSAMDELDGDIPF